MTLDIGDEVILPDNRPALVIDTHGDEVRVELVNGKREWHPASAVRPRSEVAS